MIEIDEFKNLRKIQYEEEKTQAEKLKEQLDLFDASNLLRIIGTPILMAINLLYREGFWFYDSNYGLNFNGRHLSSTT